MLKNYKIIFLIIVLAACNPQKRLSNILAKHPEYLKKDSVLVLDTIIVPGKELSLSISDDSLNNTSPEYPYVKDSNGVKETIYHYHNTTYVKSECDPDTAIHKHYNVTNNYQTIHNVHTKWYWYLICVLGGGVLVLILKR